MCNKGIDEFLPQWQLYCKPAERHSYHIRDDCYDWFDIYVKLPLQELVVPGLTIISHDIILVNGLHEGKGQMPQPFAVFCCSLQHNYHFKIPPTVLFDVFNWTDFFILEGFAHYKECTYQYLSHESLKEAFLIACIVIKCQMIWWNSRTCLKDKRNDCIYPKFI